MTNMASSGLVTPAPEMRRQRLGHHVTGLRGHHLVRDSGIARISAALENITTRPTSSRPKMIALGTLRSGSSTSSATEPAASKPEERPARRRQWRAASVPEVHVAASGMPALENKAENGIFAIEHQQDDAEARPSPTTSHVMLAMTMILSTRRPTMFTPVPRAMIRIATVGRHPPGRCVDAEDLQQEATGGVGQSAEGDRQAPHVRPRRGPAPRRPADVP